MIILDKLLAKGVGFVLEQVARAADAEGGDEERLREELLEAQLRFETGELTSDEFEKAEARLLAALRRLRRERRPGAIEARRVAVEIDIPELTEGAPAGRRVRGRRRSRGGS